MSWTAKELIEHLQTFDPSAKLYYQLAYKDDVADYFIKGISDEDWDAFCEEFTGDWEYVSETLNNIVDSKYECDFCNLYDYEAVEIDGDVNCSSCGEEKDVLE